MVQVEAMLCGTPVVATDLPGVREAVRRTGMGRIVPLRDPDALRGGADRTSSQHRSQYVRPRAAVASTFDLERSLTDYERLFAGGQCGAAHRTVIVVRYGTALFPIAIGR